MAEFFIKSIELKRIKYLDSFNIKLSDKERKHLIFTGKNGCGKTTTLKAINELLMRLFNNQFRNIESLKNNIENNRRSILKYKDNIDKSMESIVTANETIKTIAEKDKNSPHVINMISSIRSHQNNIRTNEQNIMNAERSIKDYEKHIDNFSDIDINFTNQLDMYKHINNGDFIMAFFEAKRVNNPNVPSSIQRINLNRRNPTNSGSLEKNFIQYIVNLRMEMLDAREEGELEEVEKIENWFKSFNDSLKELFDREDLELKYDRKMFNFYIQYDNRSFALNELSDGYSAIISIISNLILRMEAHEVNSYDLQGVVLIDEIETHLHVALQKKILRFLTSFFPKIQFIVTTHSPFILSSLPNTVICDLERMETVEDLTKFSYESLIDSYFDTDKYSYEVKLNIDVYKELKNKESKGSLNEEETIQLIKQENYFENLPSFQNEEIAFEINKIKQNILNESSKK